MLILTVCGVGLITLGFVVISSRQFFRVISSINVKLGKIMSFVEVDQAALDAIASSLGEIVFALQTEIDSLKVALPTADLTGIQAQVTKLSALETPAATPAVPAAPAAPVVDPTPAAPAAPVVDPAPAAPVAPVEVPAAPAAPVADPAPVTPVVDPAPVATPVVPVADPTAPVAPVVDPAAPVAAPVDPAAPTA